MATPNRFLKIVFLNKKNESRLFFSEKRIIAKNTGSIIGFHLVFFFVISKLFYCDVWLCRLYTTFYFLLSFRDIYLCVVD